MQVSRKWELGIALAVLSTRASPHLEKSPDKSTALRFGTKYRIHPFFCIVSSSNPLEPKNLAQSQRFRSVDLVLCDGVGECRMATAFVRNSYRVYINCNYTPLSTPTAIFSETVLPSLHKSISAHIDQHACHHPHHHPQNTRHLERRTNHPKHRSQSELHNAQRPISQQDEAQQHTGTTLVPRAARPTASVPDCIALRYVLVNTKHKKDPPISDSDRPSGISVIAPRSGVQPTPGCAHDQP